MTHEISQVQHNMNINGRREKTKKHAENNIAATATGKMKEANESHIKATLTVVRRKASKNTACSLLYATVSLMSRHGLDDSLDPSKGYNLDFVGY